MESKINSLLLGCGLCDIVFEELLRNTLGVLGDYLVVFSIFNSYK